MKQKWIGVVIICMCFLVGCELANTPTAQVEDLLSKYQMLDDDITVSYVDLIPDGTIQEEFQDDYEDLIKKQYRDLAYEVKEEEIDGNQATVTVEIEVSDYGEVLRQYDVSTYGSDAEYHQDVLKALKEVKDKVVYTIDFEVAMNDNDEWKVQPLDAEMKEKLLGIN